MTPDLHSKLKLLSQEFSECARNGTNEQTLEAINRTISFLESEFGRYFVLLEQLKDLREPLLPTVEEIQAIYRKQD